MKFFFAALCLSILTCGISDARAQFDSAEKRLQHYAAETPTSLKEAKAILAQKAALIEKKLEQPLLKPSELEAVHEASYTLEATVDYLREKQTEDNEEILDKLDEAVQAIHYASEAHKESETREYFSKLKTAIQEVRNVF